METKKLKNGMKLNNYKELCRLLEIPISAGSSKVAQMNDLERYCKYHKEGNSIIIDEVYDIPKEKTIGRGLSEGSKGNNKKNFPQYHINEENSNSKGIYAIMKNNEIYIGSTNVGFRHRFRQHLNQDKCKYSIKSTKRLLENGGIMIMLHNLDELDDEPLIRMVEEEYIKYFRNETNLKVLNKQLPTMVFPKNKGIKKSKTTRKGRNSKEPKKNKAIKVSLEDYELALKILKENNINVFEWREKM